MIFFFRVDYSAKECNDFQFPDTARRGSLSPELGFRNEVILYVFSYQGEIYLKNSFK